MTFLQPFVLLGLPLVLVPVIIHLLNRLRHRPKPWAAMRFLLSATRSATSHAKLRQFLILLCRVLAVAMLLLFLARPLAGGWLGWALSPAPDAIVLLHGGSVTHLVGAMRAAHVLTPGVRRDGSRLMYAYDMGRVVKELAKLSAGPAHSAAPRP